MTYRTAVGAPLAVALLVGSVVAAGSVKSGPQPGTTIPGAFHPLNVNGSAAGTKFCQV
jgi:hypothetical protein